MTEYVFISVIVVVCSLAVLIILKSDKELSIVVSAALYIIAMLYAVTEIGDVIGNLKEFVSKYDIPDLAVLLRVCGIAFVSTITSYVCEEAGQKGLATVVDVLAVVEIFKRVMPVFTEMFFEFANLLGD